MGWGRGLRQDLPSMLGQHDHTEGHRSPSALQLVEGIFPPPPQTGEHQTLMDTPLQVRLQAPDIGTEATEGVGKGNGWCQQDWICRSLSQLIQRQR